MDGDARRETCPAGADTGGEHTATGTLLLPPPGSDPTGATIPSQVLGSWSSFSLLPSSLAALRVGGEWKSWGSPVFEPGSGAVSASSLDPAPPESMSVLPLMCQAMNSWFGKVWDVQCLLSAGWTQLSSLVTQYPFPLGCGCGGCLCS